MSILLKAVSSLLVYLLVVQKKTEVQMVKETKGKILSSVEILEIIGFTGKRAEKGG